MGQHSVPPKVPQTVLEKALPTDSALGWAMVPPRERWSVPQKVHEKDQEKVLPRDVRTVAEKEPEKEPVMVPGSDWAKARLWEIVSDSVLVFA